MSRGFVGRLQERERIDAFVSSVADGPRGMVIRGEPGIGKSACWRYGVERGLAAGYRVLTARPAEEEKAVTWSGLLDLFGHEHDAFGPHDSNPLARGRAVLDLLRRLAAGRPTVIAIDDAPWLDSVSAQALRYAVRRLEQECIGVLTTVRADDPDEDRLPLTAMLPPRRADTVEVEPMDLESVREVLTGIVSSISRPRLARIHQLSQGNPMFAIELARCLDAKGDPALGASVPATVRAAIACRLDVVPRSLQPLLETVAASGPIPVLALRGLLDEADTLLVKAEELGLIVVEDDLRARFTHPLLGSVIYGRLRALTRRSLHARLAEVVTDPDLHVRHLALCSHPPDAAVAELLEGAADRARRSGASDLAFEFGRHSLRLTDVTDFAARYRRSIAQVEHLAAAGQVGDALDLVDEVIAHLPAGPERARALVRRFYVDRDDYATGEAALAHALPEAGTDTALEAQMLDLLGWVRGMFCGDLAEGVSRAEEAVATAARTGDADLQSLARAHLLHMRTLTGTAGPAAVEDIAPPAVTPDPRLGASPRAWLAKRLTWHGDLDAARDLIRRTTAEDVRAGNELERPYRLYDLALVDCAAGDLQAADTHVRIGVLAAQDAENQDAEGWLLYPQALAHALRGDAAAARPTANRLLVSTGRPQGLPALARARRVLGLLALSEGDPLTAAAELGEAAQLLHRWGVRHPGALPVLPDCIEALAAGGEIGAAARLTRRLEAEAVRVDSLWLAGHVTRAHGVLRMAGRRPGDACGPLTLAAQRFDQLGHSVDAARTILLLGRAQLLGGRRRKAAESFADARDRFAAIGARLWTGQAIADLDRSATGRSSGPLTSTEWRVASMVADGMKNRDIARGLFLGVSTVEAHLTRIYRKLEVGSRSELTRLVVDGAVGPSASLP